MSNKKKKLHETVTTILISYEIFHLNVRVCVRFAACQDTRIDPVFIIPSFSCNLTQYHHTYDLLVRHISIHSIVHSISLCIIGFNGLKCFVVGLKHNHYSS